MVNKYVFAAMGFLLAFLVFGQSETMHGIEKLPNLPLVGSVKPYATADIQPLVHLADADGQAFCSGTVFDAQYIVTAAHCLRDANGHRRKGEIRILDENGKDVGVSATAGGINNRIDYGIVFGDFRKFILAKIDVWNPVFFEPGPFVACGFPYGSTATSCTPYAPQNTTGFASIGWGTLTPGMSGGPVISVRTNAVVAVNSAMSYEPTQYGGMIVTPITGLLAAFGIENKQ